MKSTIKEIEIAIDELRNALLEDRRLDDEEENIKLKRKKSHKRLSLARDEVRALKIS